MAMFIQEDSCMSLKCRLECIITPSHIQLSQETIKYLLIVKRRSIIEYLFIA